MRSPILLSSVLLGTASTVLAEPSNEQFVSYLSRQPNAHANKYTSRSDSHLQSRKTKAADYAPAFGMAAKVIGDALGLPSAQNMPTPGYGMGMGMGMGMGRPFRRDILEDLLQRELSDEEADVLEARADEYKELVARKAADYAPAIGMAAKLIGDALGLPSAQNMPTSGYGMGMGGMGMGMGMGMGRPFRRDVLEGLFGRELSDDEADVLEARSQDEYEDLQARKAADYAPAIGMAAKLVGDALGLPSAQNMPTPGMGMGMGGMGMGRMFRRSFEELYERQLTDYDDLD